MKGIFIVYGPHLVVKLSYGNSWNVRYINSLWFTFSQEIELTHGV